MGNFIDADKVFLCGLAMRGRFLAIPRPLFYKRYHPKNYVANWRDRMAWYNPDRKGKPSFPNWLELRGFLRVRGDGQDRHGRADEVRTDDGAMGGVVLAQAGQGSAGRRPAPLASGPQATGRRNVQLGVGEVAPAPQCGAVSASTDCRATRVGASRSEAEAATKTRRLRGRRRGRRVRCRRGCRLARASTRASTGRSSRGQNHRPVLRSPEHMAFSSLMQSLPNSSISPVSLVDDLRARGRSPA